MFFLLESIPSNSFLKKILKKKWYKKIAWYYVVLAVLFLILLVNRSFPFFLYGPFGFGYDMGIYKKTFEEITNFSGIFSSAIDIFPSLLALIFNSLNIPLDYLLYYFYIFLSVFVAVPLYLLTKEHFGKLAAITSVAIFTVSYVQVFASEFYLFKAIFGASFLLLSFYFYSKKSYLFYLTAFLLALTQLPQLLLLAVGIGVATLFGGKKDFKFNLIGTAIIALAVVVLLIFKTELFFRAWNVLISSLSGTADSIPNSHNTGLFMSLAAYLHRSYLLIITGLFGFILSLKERKAVALQVSLFFVAIVVSFKLFFENRFIVEMDLLLIPFSAYFLTYFLQKLLKHKIFKTLAACSLILASTVFSYWYFITTFPALTVYEVWAIDVINSKEDANYTMVTNTIYAPWLYGFSNKETLAPGIFESVWTFEQWRRYLNADDLEKANMLKKISEKYGKYYLFVGVREPKPLLEDQNKGIKKIFEVNGAAIFEVS